MQNEEDEELVSNLAIPDEDDTESSLPQNHFIFELFDTEECSLQTGSIINRNPYSSPEAKKLKKFNNIESRRRFVIL
jgi:hypothetical protein